jgi:hypothetical protein
MTQPKFEAGLPMRKRKLGQDLDGSAIGLGCMEIQGAPLSKILNAAIDR